MMDDAVYLAGKVRRWHTHHSLNQTIADHAHGVAMLIALTNRNASADLLKVALLHDHAEYFTGDIPSPAKKEFMKLGHAAEEAEAMAFKKLGLSLPHLSYVDEMWLHWADAVEAMTFLRLSGTPVNQQMLDHLKKKSQTYCDMILKEQKGERA